MPSPHWASALVRGLETTEPLLPRFRPNPLSHDPYPDPQTCCLPIIIKQVFAIAGKTLAEDVNVETGINDAIERIGQFGINCAFPGREIEASVGRQAQSVILTALGEEGGIPAITLRSEEHTSALQSLMRI